MGNNTKRRQCEVERGCAWRSGESHWCLGANERFVTSWTAALEGNDDDFFREEATARDTATMTTKGYRAEEAATVVVASESFELC